MAFQRENSVDEMEGEHQVLHVIRVNKKENLAVIVGHDGKRINDLMKRSGAIICTNRGKASISIRGCKEAVRKAKTEIEDILQKVDSMIYQNLEIDRTLYTPMIGDKGHLIGNLRDEFTFIYIEFPEDGNQVIVGGAPEDVEICCKRLRQLESDVKKSNKINKEFTIEEDQLTKLMASPKFKELPDKFPNVRLEYPRPGQPYISLRGFYSDVTACYDYMTTIYDNLKRQASGEDVNLPFNFYQERTDADQQPDITDRAATSNPTPTDQGPGNDQNESIPPEQLRNLQGKVVKVRSHKRDGFIRPQQPLPKSFSQVKDVWFKFELVDGGRYQAIVGDMVEFDLGIMDRLEPMAVAVRRMAVVD